MVSVTRYCTSSKEEGWEERACNVPEAVFRPVSQEIAHVGGLEEDGVVPQSLCATKGQLVMSARKKIIGMVSFRSRGSRSVADSGLGRESSSSGRRCWNNQKGQAVK